MGKFLFCHCYKMRFCLMVVLFCINSYVYMFFCILCYRMARYIQLLTYMEVQDTIRNGGADNFVDGV